MANLTVKLPALYAKQYDCFYGPERFAATEATTKSGKSVGGIHWLITQTLEDPLKMASLWVSPAYSHAQAMFERLERWMMASDPNRTIWKSNKSDLWISLNGARIWFKGGENYDAIYGVDYGRAIIDEASRCRPEVWDAVFSTLTATEGKCRIIGNVKGRKNWAWKKARAAQAGAKDWTYHKLTALDAVDGGVMKQSVFEAAKENLSHDAFMELFMAEATEDGSNPFRLDCIAKCIKPISNLPPVCFGIDLARKHDFTVVIGLDCNGDICRVQRFNGTDWATAMARIQETIGDTLSLADATGVGDPIVEQLGRVCEGVKPFLFTSTSKQQIMGGLAVAIQHQKVSVLDGVIRSELESFEYTVTPSGNVRYSAPDGEFDDCVCALAMAVSAFDIYATTPTPFVYVVGASSGTRKVTAIENNEAMWTKVGGRGSFGGGGW